jgi:tetratricopeptide (TPR) repeat protein
VIHAQADAHGNLAFAHEQLGHYEHALDHANQALVGYRRVEIPALEAVTLAMVGWLHACLSRYDEARVRCEAALTLTRQHRHAVGEAITLANLGYIAHHTGDDPLALDYYELSLNQFRNLGHTFVEAEILEHLGDAHAALDHRDDARQAWELASRLYRHQHRTEPADRVDRHLDALARGQSFSEPAGADV